MYVETDFLFALLKDDDWFAAEAEQALADHDDIHTSILSYAELLVALYDRNESEYAVESARAVTNLLELVPIQPQTHEDAVLAASAFLEENDLTPFDALHAGIVSQSHERVLSSERDYDTLGVTRLPLEPSEGGPSADE